MLLTPEYIFRAIEAITPEFLRQHGITALVLDVDNTLTGDGSQQLDATVQQWLDTMRAAGVRLTIVSNNTAARVRPFADRVGLAWVPLACKPFTAGRPGRCPPPPWRSQKSDGHGGRPDLYGPPCRGAVRHPLPVYHAAWRRPPARCAVQAQV